MDAATIMSKVGRSRDLYNKGISLNQKEPLEEALAISLELRNYIDNTDKSQLAKEIDQFHHLDGGLNAHIFNLMSLLGQLEKIIPFLERTLDYLDNDKNPNLWRQLGLLYLVQEEDIDKACSAWKKAIELDPFIIEKYPGLNLVYTYQALKSSGKSVSWKVLHADLETGDFSVSLG